MGFYTEIHNKLITDFAILDIGGGQNFGAVKKAYRAETMQPLDCLIMPDTSSEQVTGGSAGNTATTRQYGFAVSLYELINSTDDDSVMDIKYSRLTNCQDAILDYLEVEPNSLRTWALNLNEPINLFKIRVTQVFYDRLQAENGFAEQLLIRFSVFVNVVPQNL